jgi:hypothetical protein
MYIIYILTGLTAAITMSSESAKQRLEDMMRKYCESMGNKLPEIEELRDVLSQLSNQQRIDILQKKYPLWYTPLNCASYGSGAEILSTLLTSVESADRMKLLLPTYPLLHAAAWCGHTESVKVILDSLTADQQLKIMSVQDLELTPI